MRLDFDAFVLSRFKGKCNHSCSPTSKNVALPTHVFDQAQVALKHLDDLVSMSDGQIWLGDHALVDVSKSLSRVGVGKDTNFTPTPPCTTNWTVPGSGLIWCRL